MTLISRLIGLLLISSACSGRTARIPNASTGATLRADSTQYSVHVNGALYETVIGFSFVNTTGRTLSMSQCHAPSPPALEKQRSSGEWVHAYSPVELMCLTLPPFRIRKGETYRGTVKVAAGRPGTNMLPMFGPDSVPGTYRLRWALRAGAEPDDQTAPMIVATSSPFTLIMR